MPDNCPQCGAPLEAGILKCDRCGAAREALPRMPDVELPATELPFPTATQADVHAPVELRQPVEQSGPDILGRQKSLEDESRYGPSAPYSIERTIESPRDSFSPTSVAIGGDELLVLSLPQQGGEVEVSRFHRQTGELLSEVGRYAEGEREGCFRAPASMAVAPNGDLWIVDAGNNRVQLLGKDGKCVRSIGGEGEGPGHFRNPTGIFVDTEGNAYVADSGNNRVQKVDPQGRLLLSVGEPEAQEDEDWEEEEETAEGLNHPSGVTVSAEGEIIVADTNNHRIALLSCEGGFIRAFGQQGVRGGSFFLPSDVHLLTGGALFICDLNSSRIQSFTCKGEFVWAVRFDILERPMARAGTFAVDDEGLLYLADPRTRRVLVVRVQEEEREE